MQFVYTWIRIRNPGFDAKSLVPKTGFFRIRNDKFAKISPIGIPGLKIKSYIIEYFGIAIGVDVHSTLIPTAPFLHSEPRGLGVLLLRVIY